MNERTIADDRDFSQEVALHALAANLAREHRLFDRHFDCRDEWSGVLTAIVLDQRLDPEPATYLASALSDLVPAPKE